jgi:microcystin-dependent protein
LKASIHPRIEHGARAQQGIDIMAEPFLGQITLFAFNFAPRTWALCQGQILPIAQNTALFSLLGTAFGGNGTSTFGLPNLQGRVAVDVGQGPGLSPYTLGDTGGSPQVTLTIQTMASHNHGFAATLDRATVQSASGNVLATGASGPPQKPNVGTYYSVGSVRSQLAPQSVSLNGNSQPHNNMQPYLALNYCIALQGIFPPRP